MVISRALQPKDDGKVGCEDEHADDGQTRLIHITGNEIPALSRYIRPMLTRGISPFHRGGMNAVYDDGAGGALGVIWDSLGRGGGR